MNIIWGSSARDSGDILIDNTTVNFTSEAEAKLQGIAMVHQDCSLIDHFSVK